jgi:hypothetical protein
MLAYSKVNEVGVHPEISPVQLLPLYNSFIKTISLEVAVHHFFLQGALQLL